MIRCTESLVRIPADGGIRLAPVKSEYGDYELAFRQRSEQFEHIKTPIPRELWIEVNGPAPSIDVAINIAVSMANEYVRQLAFGSNAWQGLVGVHLAYDSSQNSAERQFFQNWVVDEGGLPRVAREVDVHLMYSYLVAIAKTNDDSRARLLRAMFQYTDALQHWRAGSELYALSHLYMGIEAITPLVIQKEVANRGLKNREELEIALNGPPPDSLKLRVATYLYRRFGGYIPSRLEPWARREVIFRGDRTTYRVAQRASNQLEHGVAHHANIPASATQAVTKTAAYLRDTVLGLLPLSTDDRERLKTGLYASPLSTSGYERQLVGTIKSMDGEIASPDQLHPYVRWEFNLLDYTNRGEGAGQMHVNQKIQPFLGRNAQLTIERIRFSGATPTSHTNVEFDVTKGDQPKELIVTRAGAELAIDAPGVREWAHLLGSYMLNTNALPFMARFWLAKLDSQVTETAASLSLSECVGRISAILHSDARLAGVRAECVELWQAGLGAQDVGMLLSTAFTGKTGIVIPVSPANGQAAEMSDPKELRELSDRSVDLTKALAAMLDRVIALRV